MARSNRKGAYAPIGNRRCQHRHRLQSGRWLDEPVGHHDRLQRESHDSRHRHRQRRPDDNDLGERTRGQRSSPFRRPHQPGGRRGGQRHRSHHRLSKRRPARHRGGVLRRRHQDRNRLVRSRWMVGVWNASSATLFASPPPPITDPNWCSPENWPVNSKWDSAASSSSWPMTLPRCSPHAPSGSLPDRRKHSNSKRRRAGAPASSLRLQ